MNNLAIIPARGGSKRIPRKNVKKFAGKPVISYSIEAALKSKIFDEVMVSTDDEDISSIAQEYGASVPFLRSPENSDDYAGVADVCLEVIENYQKAGRLFDHVCCIFPTAPLIQYKNLLEAIQLLNGQKFDCVFTAVEYGYPIQRSLQIDDGFIRMRWPENFPKRSQDLEKTYHDAGQFYLIKTSTLLNEKKLFAEKSGAIILSELEVQDIDSETDWRLAELKYKMLNT